MDALWIALTVVAACLGGWPVTSGVLKLSTSRAVAAVELAESGQERLANEPDDADDPAADITADAGSNAGPAAQDETASDSSPPARQPQVGVMRGGLLIGVLERAAVVLAILTNQPVAIAYVVAIKGLGRYPELKNTPAASERFIIGTLASMLWAAAIAVLAKVLLL